jgi:hypothetical protein
MCAILQSLPDFIVLDARINPATDVLRAAAQSPAASIPSIGLFKNSVRQMRNCALGFRITSNVSSAEDDV